MLSEERTPEVVAEELSRLVKELVDAGRNDLLLRSIGVSVLETLRIEAARRQLSRLLITKDYRFILIDDNHKEIDLTPVHKAVYLLFLNHPEGIEFKKLSEYRDELLHYYMATARLMDKQAIEKSVDMLVNPFNNSINEKCSRIKSVFLSLMDQYRANYYIVSSHHIKHVAGSSRVWYERLKVISLPRELVIKEE
ncbi:MAG: hypothetical protein IJJ68_03645 [Prevotella sp.]|nr:hypothetical protein [Prevotella sp.]